MVVEEPDEEPKIYQQQAYNAKIESKKAAAAAAASAAAAAAAAAAATIITPPATPTSCPSPSRSSSKPPPQVDPVPPTTQARTRPAHQRYVSPAAGHRMSSSSTNRSYRRRKRNKMKYRRQQAEQQKEGPSNGFQMPKYPPRYPLTPPPSKHFQQSFFSHDVEMNPPGTTGTPFQWVIQPIVLVGTIHVPLSSLLALQSTCSSDSSSTIDTSAPFPSASSSGRQTSTSHCCRTSSISKS